MSKCCLSCSCSNKTPWTNARKLGRPTSFFEDVVDLSCCYFLTQRLALEMRYLCSSRHIGWTRHFPRDRSLACKATKVPKAQMCFVGTLTWSWYPWSCWLLSKTPLDLKCIQFCRIFLPRKAGRPYLSLSKSSRHATRKGLTPPKNSFSELYFFEWSLWTQRPMQRQKKRRLVANLPQKPLCI